MRATISSKGQITLAKALRERFHLSTGDRVEFVIAGHDAVHKKLARHDKGTLVIGE